MTPDGAVLAYLELRQALSSAPPASLSVSLGRAYAKRCDRCGSAGRFEGKHQVQRCSRCGDPWPVEEVEVLRGQVQTSRRAGGGRAARLARLATLGQALDAVPPVERWALERYVAWGGPGRADVGLAELGRECWPDAPFDWTQYRVRQLVRTARQLLEAELERLGLDG